MVWWDDFFFLPDCVVSFLLFWTESHIVAYVYYDFDREENVTGRVVFEDFSFTRLAEIHAEQARVIYGTLAS